MEKVSCKIFSYGKLVNFLKNTWFPTLAVKVDKKNNTGTFTVTQLWKFNSIIPQGKKTTKICTYYIHL